GPAGDVLVLTRGEHLRAPAFAQPRRRGRLLPSAANDRKHEGLEAGVGGIEDDELGKERREQAGEGAGEGGPGPVTLPPPREEAVAVEARRQRLAQLLEERSDRLIEDDVRGRLAHRLAL